MEQQTEKMPNKNLFSTQINLAKFEKATEEEKRQQDVMSESTTFFKDGMRKLMKNPLAVMRLIFLIFSLLAITVAPMVVPYSYSQNNTVNCVRDKTAKKSCPL